jgi:hypothetical protein
MGGGWEIRSRMQDLEKDAFWRAKVSNLMRGAVFSTLPLNPDFSWGYGL